MNVNPIELITTASGAQPATTGTDSPSSLFAGLLLATNAANRNGDEAATKDPLTELADLLGVTVPPSAVPAMGQTAPELTGLPPNVVAASPPHQDGSAETPPPLAESDASPSAATPAHSGLPGQAIQQASTGASAPAGPLPPASGQSTRSDAVDGGRAKTDSPAPVQSVPSASREGSEALARGSSTAVAAPDLERAAAKAVSPAPFTEPQSVPTRTSLKAGSGPEIGAAVGGARPSPDAGVPSTGTQVTVSHAAVSSQPTAPVSPETAAAIMSVREQGQVAAQTGAPPQGAAVGTSTSSGQTTREARQRTQNTRPQVELSSADPTPGPRARALHQPGAAAAARSQPSNALPQQGAPALPSEQVPGTAQPGAVPASFTATPGELISSTGLQSESERGHWRPAAPTDQVAVHIKKAIGEGKDRVTVRLEPAELGRIEVKLAASSDGTIRAAIMAERPETLDLLQNDSRALERALQDAGLKTNNDSLSFNLRGEGQNDKLAGQEQEGDRAGQDDRDPADDALPADDPSTKRSHHDGSLDISV